MRRRQLAAAEHARRERRARVRACEDVLRQFLDHSGHLTRDLAQPEELRRLIEDGASPAELRKLLEERLQLVDGPLLGHQQTPGGDVPVMLPRALRLRHELMLGKTGSGKTTAIRNRIGYCLRAGEGLLALSPEADLIEAEVLPLIPPERLDDVVLIDPADLGQPVSLNPLHLQPGEDPDRRVDELMSVFARLTGDEDGSATPRMENILREGIHPLIRIPGMTLLDLERLLDREDDSFRRWVVGQTTDERTRHFWTTTYPSYPKGADLPLRNRLGRFLRPRAVREILCAPGSGFSLRSAMDTGKVVLVKAADGLLGPANAQLIMHLMVAELQLAAMSRADLPPERRRFFTAFLDEWETTANPAATSYATLAARARKHGVGLVLALQSLSQVSTKLIRQVLSNTAVLVAFQISADDARRLAREMVGEVDGRLRTVRPEDFLSLRVGEAICRIDRRVFRLTTLPPPAGGDPAVREEVRRRSRLRYGTPVAPENSDRDDGRARLAVLDPREVF
jgi:hypothetical protein